MASSVVSEAHAPDPQPVPHCLHRRTCRSMLVPRHYPLHRRRMRHVEAPDTMALSAHFRKDSEWIVRDEVFFNCVRPVVRKP